MPSSHPLELVPFEHAFYVVAGISVLLALCVLFKMVQKKIKSPILVQSVGTSVVYLNDETDTEWSDSNGLDDSYYMSQDRSLLDVEILPRIPNTVQMTINDYANLSTLHTKTTKITKKTKKQCGNFFRKAAGKRDYVIIEMAESTFPNAKED